MKKFLKILLFNYAFCIMHSASGQNPLVKQWDYRFGGIGAEALYSMQHTSDGGFILGGFSLSGISGDKTQVTRGGADYWIVKTDANGIKQWDKDFGGTNEDYLYSIQETSDKGFILGGYSLSGSGGDRTQPSWGGLDYWIVKTDSLGNKQWDKVFGGTDNDQLYSIQQTSDGGFILGGLSKSGVGGDKTQPLHASFDDVDYWIVKTDSLGNKQWDKDFGGDEADNLFSVQQTSDGGFILGGYSFSGSNGDKTQPSWGGWDYWIVKTDALGNKQWDKAFGGSEYDLLWYILQTPDGGFLFGGTSGSGISGNKTQPSWGAMDFWVVKTDMSGNIQWQKDYGGTNNEDDMGSITPTSDGGYLIAGTSYSGISGNKTENNLGGEQIWVLKIDSAGNVLWDKTVLTTGHEEYGMAIQAEDGCYLIGNFTDAGIGGDKTQPTQGYLDYWILKFCETLQTGFTSPSLLCPGTCIDFTNLSNQATSYTWSFPGATPNNSTDINPANICYANPGTYDVQLIASNANGSDTLLIANYITVFPQPSPQSIFQSGDTLFAVPGFAAYQWFHDGNLISGATNFYLSLQDSGDFNVIATDTNGCEVEAAIYDVHIGIEELSFGNKIRIYPNPVQNKLTIQKPQITRGIAETEISIYNVIGEKINLVIDPEQWTIDCRPLPEGLYFLEIKSGNKIYKAKFVKQLP